MKHNDDDPVMARYASSRNISFCSRGGEELGITWGEWREMSDREQSEILQEYMNELVDVWIEEDE